MTNYFQTVNKEDFLVFLSFFLPIRLTIINESQIVESLEDVEKKYRISPGEGKFYNMMKMFLKENFKRNLWIGWSGVYPTNEKERKLLEEYLLKTYSCFPLFFEKEKIDLFLKALCNSRLAGVFHNLVEEGSVDSQILEESLWQVYTEISKEFAHAAVMQAFKPKLPSNEEILFFIHDYHLMKVPGFLRRMIINSANHNQKKHKIGYYLNRYFPPPELFQRVLPPKSLIASLLFCDVITFPLYDFAKNFFTCVEKYFRIQLRTFKGGDLCLVFHGRVILIRISHPNIDPAFLEDIIEAASFKTSFIDYSKQMMQDKIFLGIDALSKYAGLELKFHAFRIFAKESDCGNLKLIQIVNEGKDSEFKSDAEAQEYKQSLFELASKINNELNSIRQSVEVNNI